MRSSQVPVPIAGLTSGVTAVSVGDIASCAVTSGGGVQCWGDNTLGVIGVNNIVVGVLGNNCVTSSTVPVPVTGF